MRTITTATAITAAGLLAVAGCSGAQELANAPVPETVTVTQTAPAPAPATVTVTAPAPAPQDHSNDQPDAHDPDKVAKEARTQQGPAVFKVGETATYTVQGKRAATITVKKVQVINHALTSYGDPPKHHYVKALVEVSVLKGITASDFDPKYHVNPFNWTLYGPKGFKFQQSIPFGVEHTLPATDLAPGGHVQGWVLFDAPKHGELKLTMGLTGPQAVWSY